MALWCSFLNLETISCSIQGSVTFCPAYRFLRRQVGWSGIPIPLRDFHTVKGFGIVDETEVGVFLKFPSFFYDPVNAGNLIPDSSSFSKPSLDIWNFLVCIMLKPSMQDIVRMTLLICEMVQLSNG